MPLQEIIVDFHDKIKSASKGYASFDYEFLGYKESDLVKLTIMINKEPVMLYRFWSTKIKLTEKQGLWWNN